MTVFTPSCIYVWYLFVLYGLINDTQRALKWLCIDCISCSLVTLPHTVSWLVFQSDQSADSADQVFYVLNIWIFIVRLDLSADGEQIELVDLCVIYSSESLIEKMMCVLLCCQCCVNKNDQSATNSVLLFIITSTLNWFGRFSANHFKMLLKFECVKHTAAVW